MSQVSTSFTLWFMRYSPDKIFKLKVITARSKVKSKSHHDVPHLHPEPLSLSSINFLHLRVSEIQPGQTFPDNRTPANPGAIGEKHTQTTLTDITLLEPLTGHENIFPNNQVMCSKQNLLEHAKRGYIYVCIPDL